MSGSMGCGGLGVSGGGGDSVIKILEPAIQTSISFPQAEGITETISESVSVIVT